MAWQDDVLKIALANPDVIVPPEALSKPAKRNKFGNVRCEFQGMKFDSKAELSRYGFLRSLELTNQITDLEYHPIFQLAAKIKYEADFRYIEDGRVVVEEVKGFETASWKMKKKLFLDMYPDIELRVIRV